MSVLVPGFITTTSAIAFVVGNVWFTIEQAMSLWRGESRDQKNAEGKQSRR